MLKITTQNENGVIRFLVEGKLVDGWIDVLEHCWKEVLSRSNEIHVEFTDITFIEDRAKKLLKQMAASGVKLFARDVHMKAIIKQIEIEMLSPGETI